MSRPARSIHFGLILLGCFGGGSLYGWSGYLPAVRVAFGVSNAAGSMVFSIALVSFTLGVLLGPMLLGRVPLRFRLPLLTGLSALSLGVAGICADFAGFTLAYGISFGFIAGALYNHAVSTASASVTPTLLVPVSVAAFGLGGVVFGPVHVWLTSAGWGLWAIAPALVSLAAVTIAALTFSPLPEAATATPPVPISILKPDKTIAILWALFAAGSCSGLIVLGFATQFLSTSEGVGLAGLAVFLAALGNTLGRLSCTLIAGVFGPARGIAGALVLSILALTGLIATSAPGTVVGLLFLVAFAYGQLAATTPLLVKSQVNSAAFSGSFGWVFTGWGVAGLVGPWTAGALLDATGSLRIPLIICIALAALSLWLVVPFATRDRRAETR